MKNENKIGLTYANYTYPDNDKGMFPFEEKECLVKYINGFAKACMQAGILYTTSEKHEGHMRALMSFAFETADKYGLPCIVETDEGLKRDKYCHLGVHQVLTRNFGDDRYSYGMIREFTNTSNN